MKLFNLKKTMFLGMFLISINYGYSKNIESYWVNCQNYALDMLDVIEAHFGCIEDAETYNQVATELVNLCEAMDK